MAGPLAAEVAEADVRPRQRSPPNGLELSCPAEAGNVPLILAHIGGPGTPPYAPARRVSFSELLGSGPIATYELHKHESWIAFV